MNKVRILLVDDHAIVREGYRSLLNRQANLELVAEAASGEQAYALYRTQQPDLVVLDLSLPGKGGLATLIQIRQFDPAARVLIFSMHQNPAMAMKAIEAGARGYVTKSSEPEVLLKAVAEVMQGKIALSDDMSHALALERLGGDKGLLAELTAREFEILRMLVEGKSKTDIAETLHISAKTVANCHYIIKRKLNVQSDIELLRVAMQHELINRSELQ
ncbi:response regulator transcription factor [Pontibacter sp. JAM-7]|uniref:response regulator transcription factor n=1 Tax=Pontibacter sp. JAM-7 TaxID=3366581 RepID=UPI003AF9D8E0